jgi:hypothetical protein
MKRTIGKSLLLFACAGAAAVEAAGDVNGNNVALNGSDALYGVTQEVLSVCPGASGRGISYRGGGTAAGIYQMLHTGQRVAPAGRAFKDNEYCTMGAPTTPGGPSSPANTEALLLGVDGISLLANKDTTCSSDSANGVGTTWPVPGQPDYVAASSIDTLSLLYFGRHNGTGGSTNGKFDCNSAQRRALVASWKNLFSTDCASGDSV